jgi:glycine/D-amino acid oxidase-like deaminating enzyme
MSGRGYVVPEPDGTLTCGSSYSNDFDDLSPEPEQTAYILDKTSKMLPGIDAMEPLDVRAGVRVKTESTNLPIVGPMPGRDRIWTLTALGSKGLLTAPMLSLELPGYLRDPATIPEPVRL